MASAAIVAALALAALPLPLAALIALTLFCLPLVLRTPLAMLAVLLTLSPLRSLIAAEAGAVFPLDIGQVLLALYAACWLSSRIARREPILQLRAEPVFASVCALCAVFALGAWRGGGFVNWLTEWLKWAAIAFMIWHLCLSARSSWRWLIFALLVSAAANAIVGWYIFFGGSGADHLLILSRYFRAFGTFGQPNPFGGFMGIALPLSLALGLSQLAPIAAALRGRSRLKRQHILVLLASAAAFALLLGALLASWSRGAWLGFAAALAMMLVAWPRRLFTGIALALAFGALLFALWHLGLLPNSIVNRVAGAATDLLTLSDARGIHITPFNYAVVERLAHWQAALAMAEAQPFFGVGLGNYAAAYDAYRLINWEEPLGHAHNLYLNVLAESGIVGLSAYLGFWIVIFGLTWSCRRHPGGLQRAVVVGLLGCWTYISVHSVFDNLFVNNLFLHIGVLLSVLAILRLEATQALELE